MFHVAIPARFASTRLPGKPLRLIGGKAMLQHVYERSLESGAASVSIATDDARVVKACEAFSAPVYLTSEEHRSGSDRIAELAQKLNWDDDALVVNVQGDEPFIPPALIAQVAELLASHPAAKIATLASAIVSREAMEDPNLVKVVTAKDGSALYFSRAPIPWDRQGSATAGDPRPAGALGHIGIYAYRVAALKSFASTPVCELEATEQLEQLRALWLGMCIQVGIAVEAPGPGIDTEEDLGSTPLLRGLGSLHSKQHGVKRGHYTER